MAPPQLNAAQTMMNASTRFMASGELIFVGEVGPHVRHVRFAQRGVVGDDFGDIAVESFRIRTASAEAHGPGTSSSANRTANESAVNEIAADAAVLPRGL